MNFQFIFACVFCLIAGLTILIYGVFKLANDIVFKGTCDVISGFLFIVLGLLYGFAEAGAIALGMLIILLIQTTIFFIEGIYLLIKKEKGGITDIAFGVLFIILISIFIYLVKLGL